VARARTPKFTAALIVVDTRESLPLGFPGASKQALATGDYSVLGMEERVAVERKTLGDFYTCVGRERARFERELERLGAMDYGAVVIEASLSDILHGAEFSKVHPRSAIGSILAWSVKYRLPFFFAENRRRCRTTVYHLLKHFWTYHHDESEENDGNDGNDD
jgi:ERCC4-type nuclease